MIRRSNKNGGKYKKIDAAALDARLSGEAYAVLMFLLGKSDDWDVVAGPIARHFSWPEGKIYKAFHELEATGRLKKLGPRRVGNRNRGWIYEVIENPSQTCCSEGSGSENSNLRTSEEATNPMQTYPRQKENPRHREKKKENNSASSGAARADARAAAEAEVAFGAEQEQEQEQEQDSTVLHTPSSPQNSVTERPPAWEEEDSEPKPPRGLCESLEHDDDGYEYHHGEDCGFDTQARYMILPTEYEPVLAVYSTAYEQRFGAKPLITERHRKVLYRAGADFRGSGPFFDDYPHYHISHFRGPLLSPLFVDSLLLFCRSPVADWKDHEWEVNSKDLSPLVVMRDGVVNRLLRLVQEAADERNHNTAWRRRLNDLPTELRESIMVLAQEVDNRREQEAQSKVPMWRWFDRAEAWFGGAA